MSRSKGNDGEPLDVNMSGEYGKPEGIAAVLISVGKHMKAMPEATRYDFELSITERKMEQDNE